MATDSVSSNALRQRFLRELENSVAVLDGVESAAVAEAWASSAVAEWLAMGGQPGTLSDQLIDHRRAEAVVAWIEGADAPGGESWLGDVGTHVPVQAWDLHDPAMPGERGLIVAFEAVSGERHEISVTIVDGQLVAVVVGPPGLADAASEEVDSQIEFRDVSVVDATTMVRRVITNIAPDFSVVSEASLPLLTRRFGLPQMTFETSADRAIVIPERDYELEQYGADVIRSALRAELGSELPQSVSDALTRCNDALVAAEPDVSTLLQVGGLSEAEPPLDIDGLCALVGAYFAPATLEPHAAVEQEALVQLEVADWIGVVISIARAKVGTEVDGEMLVRSINRTPEITTTIPKKHAASLAWTFETMLYSWEVTGVLIDGAVGPAAQWLLPNAALAVWGERQS